MMLNEENINPEDLGLIHLTDSPRDAVDFVVKTFNAGGPVTEAGSGIES